MKNNLNTGDLLVFTMSGPLAMITIVVMKYGINEEDTEEDSDRSNEASKSDEEEHQ